jgi:hypothetical protein
MNEMLVKVISNVLEYVKFIFKAMWMEEQLFCNSVLYIKDDI